MRFFRLLALLLGVFAIVGVFQTAHAQAAPKIATVDFQRAINTVKEGVTAQAKLKGLYEQKKAAIDQMEKKLGGMQTDYQKQALLLSDAAKKQKEQEIMQAEAVYQQTAGQAEQEMQSAYAGLMERLVGQMKVTCEQIGKEKGYNLILEVSQGAVVYVGGTPDLTDELIKRYDAAHPG